MKSASANVFLDLLTMMLALSDELRTLNASAHQVERAARRPRAILTVTLGHAVAVSLTVKELVLSASGPGRACCIFGGC